MRVQATDVYGDPLEVSAQITVEQLGADAGRRRQIAEDVPPDGSATFATDVVHHYRVRVHAAGYGNAARQVPGTIGELAVAVPIAADAVAGFRWPDPLPEIPGVHLEELTDRRRGTLLNIWAKLWDVNVSISPAQVFVNEVLEARDDRIIVTVADELPALLADQDHLEAVPSKLHEPPVGYINGISVKSNDEHGNIQISTFIVDPALPQLDGLPTLADIDIDENRKTFAHLFDVLEHAVTGDVTDFVEVHAILVVSGVDPGWRPLVA